MKRIVVTMLGLLFMVSLSTAQDIYLGPYLLLKAGVNAASVPEGLKTNVNFNGIPDFGLTGRWMFNRHSNMGLVLDLGYSTYSFRIGPDNAYNATDASTIVFKPSYITLAPSLYLSGITLGVAFGFPAAYSVKNAEGTDKSDQFGTDIQDLNSPAIELRVGGMIPVMKSEQGVLNIVLQGGYILTGMINNTALPKYSTTFNKEDTNPKIVSFGVGINYLFNLSEL